MKQILNLIRIKHWIKNFFIFVPLFLSGNLFDIEKIINTSIVFFGFSLVASFVYIVNDIFDVEFDKQHPIKKNRPLASGVITKNNALIIGVLIFIIGLFLIYIISVPAFIISLLYFIINVFYSYILKHISIIDFIVLSMGFVLRILIGGYVGEIELSKWIIVMVFLLSLFLSVSKRRDDVFQYQFNNKINRSVVTQYSVEYMDKLISIISSILLVSYLFFISSDEVLDKNPSDYHIFSFLFVLIGVFRYNQITYVYNKSGSPVNILYKDIFLKITIVLWIVTFFLTIYNTKF